MCCRYTTTPKYRPGVCVSIVSDPCLCSSFPVVADHAAHGARSRTQRHSVISRVRATGPRLPFANVAIVQVGMAGLEPAILCSQSTWVRHYPTSRHPVRTGGFEPPISWSPTRRDNQASPRSAASSSCGSRTRLHALKGRDPRTDRRTSRLSAYLSRSGSGGARIRVCGFSGRRYTVSATDPNEKSLVSS